MVRLEAVLLTQVFAEYPGTNLSDKWTYVFAPRSLVRARTLRRVPPLERRDMEAVITWLQSRSPYVNDWSRTWNVIGPFVVMLPDDLALEFKMRWC